MKYVLVILLMCGVAFASQEPMSIEEVAAAGPYPQAKEEEEPKETEEEREKRVDQIKAKIETKKEARTADASVSYPTGSAAGVGRSNDTQTPELLAGTGTEGIRVNATAPQGNQRGNNNGGIGFSNIYELFGTIDDRTVGETPAVIGMTIVRGKGRNGNRR